MTVHHVEGLGLVVFNSGVKVPAAAGEDGTVTIWNLGPQIVTLAFGMTPAGLPIAPGEKFVCQGTGESGDGNITDMTLWIVNPTAPASGAIVNTLFEYTT